MTFYCLLFLGFNIAKSYRAHKMFKLPSNLKLKEKLHIFALYSWIYHYTTITRKTFEIIIDFPLISRPL
jgi:hypothetical protein